MPVLVGLDVGTTSSKAVVMNLDGHELAHGRAATRWESTAEGTEIDAAALLDGARAAIREAIQEALSAAPGEEVLGLGVASMAESGVLLGRDGAVMGPVIAWHDTRDAGQVTEARAALGADEFALRTGLPLRSQWSLTKHRWLMSHVPAAADAARRLNIAEWIVRSLGGDEVSEPSLASRTGWLDVSRGEWWPPAMEWAGIRPGLLPPLVPAGTALGRVTAAAGLPRLTGAVLTVAGHDHQVAAIGAGATGAGDELDSCGTAEAIVRTVPPGLAAQPMLELTRAGITVGWHALPGHWCLLGGTEGGLVMQRALGQLGVDAADALTLDTDAWRATLTEVTAEARELHDAMSRVAGPHGQLIAVGGWLRSAPFVAVKRQIFGPLLRPVVEEAGARGAALLAGLAAGAYPDLSQLPGPAMEKL